jgi:hypothetical protein
VKRSLGVVIVTLPATAVTPNDRRADIPTLEDVDALERTIAA